MSALDDTTARGDTETDPADVGTRSGATEHEPITGPMPVLELAGGHVHLSQRRDVTIIAIDGGLDHDLAEAVAPTIEDVSADAAAVIVDLDQATVLDHDALERVCDALAAGGETVDRCLVAGRLSSRLVLDRWEIPARVAMFTSVADALQAREFAGVGYGTGWDVDPRRAGG